MRRKAWAWVALAASAALFVARFHDVSKAQSSQPPQPASNAPGQFSDASLQRLLAAVRVSPEQDSSPAAAARIVMGDQSAVNTSHNRGLAPDYLGLPTFHDRGAIRLDTAHVTLTGYTRGWDAGTCVLAVLANAPPGTSACNQGGFWDPNYRWVYPGQDSAAAFFGINGITPVIRDAHVAAFGTETLTNPGGQRQVVGTVRLATPLRAEQIHAINDAAGPMRIQVNNGFFAYVLPAGFTSQSNPIDPAAADGRTILVDNWVRAVQPGIAAPPGTPGGTAAKPSLPYWTQAGVQAGTGILPNQVGHTNGSPPLSDYTVTIDGNLLAEAQYGGFKITDDDIVNDARYLEIVGVNNKTGKPTWNELQPTEDQVDGQPMMTHLIFAGCQNDDGQGLGVCGALLVGENGLKRVVVCSNPQATPLEGATDCVLDTSSTIGWKSTKQSGYVFWVDPGATGTPRAVMDWNGNFNLRSRMFVGDDSTGVTLNPDGTALATGTITSEGNVVAKALAVPGAFQLAGLPACSAAVLGAHVFVTDARKPDEPAGRGSGVPADCVPARIGSAPSWISVYSHAAISR